MDTNRRGIGFRFVIREEAQMSGRDSRLFTHIRGLRLSLVAAQTLPAEIASAIENLIFQKDCFRNYRYDSTPQDQY